MKLDEHISALNAASMGSDIRAPLVNALRDLYEVGKDADALVDKDGNIYKAEHHGNADDIELKRRKEGYNLIMPADDTPTPGSSKLAKSSGIYAMIGDLESLRRLLPNA